MKRFVNGMVEIGVHEYYMGIRVTIKIVCLLAFVSILTGCAHYQVPALTHDHPACPDISSTQIQLSPILEIDPVKRSVPSSHGVH